MKSFVRCAVAVFWIACISTFAIAEDKYANFNGVKIRYIDQGKGEPIALLHGGTSNLENWVSRSRVMRQAPAGMKPTDEEIQKRIAACRADKNFDQYSTAASLRGYHDQAVTPEQMQAVKVPTLGVVGTLDHTLKEMQELKKLRPDMTLVLVEGVPHTGPNGIQGRPELIAAIREFIARHRR